MATAKKTTKAAPKKAAARKPATKASATKSTAAKKTAKVTVDGQTKAAAAASDEGFRLSLGNVELSTVDLKGVVTDSAYAYVGAGDRAVEFARHLPQQLENLRKERAETLVKDARGKVQSFMKETPAKLQTELHDGVETARKEFETFAVRGRKVVESITKADSTQKALDQTENARTAVKGAVTSIRKAVEQGQEAVEGAVERIGLRRSA